MLALTLEIKVYPESTHSQVNDPVIKLVFFCFKFLKEQAAQSATELTVDSVNEFLADSGDDSETEDVPDYSKGTQHTWEKILMNVMEMSSLKIIGQDIFQFKSGSSIKVPKVNGKHNKSVKSTSLTKSKGDPQSQVNGVAKMIFADVPMYKEVLPGLESWRDGKVSSWSDFEGHSVQWMCMVCIDRRGNYYFVFVRLILITEVVALTCKHMNITIS